MKHLEMTVRQCNKVWPINIDGFFKTKVSEQMLNDDLPVEAVEGIFQNAAKILANCPNPYIEEKDGKTGIVIGKVQSGKTSNFISLTALAFDNNYDIVIVLGGNKTNLLEQNKTRIQSSFNVAEEKLVVLTTNQNSSILNPVSINRFLLEKRKVIIVCLKWKKSHIDRIISLFSDHNLRETPVLIIDDEGDQASLNTQKKGMSTTFGAIKELKDRIDKHCFISVTATPQANILIETTNLLSPDFGILVYPGNDYCGLPDFHGEEQDKYVKVIPDDEPNMLDTAGVPNSFYKALGSFFVGAAIRQHRGDYKDHSMLIHPSQRISDHKTVIKKVEILLNIWQQKAAIRLSGVNDISYNKLKDYLINAYEEYKNDGVKVPLFEDIELLILENILKCSPIHLCNSQEDATENSKFYKLNIFVGGNMVERGITLKGLAVTYITRRAKGKSNVDNTEQRARWFGYKKSYLDVCRVYMTSDIKRDFSAILVHDEDLWDTIERAQKKGTNFKDIPRIFKLPEKMLQLTRKNVAVAERFSFSEWTRQDKILLNKDAVQKNDELLKGFRSSNIDKVKEINYNEVQCHKIIKGLSFFELKKAILDNYIFPNNCHMDLSFFSEVEEALRKCNIEPIIDVIWIRDYVHQTRTIYEDGTINQLFQGRNPNKNSATYYDGDSRMIQDRPDIMQLQIHYVKPNNMPDINYYSPVIALYIPSNYSVPMADLVGQV